MRPSRARPRSQTSIERSPIRKTRASVSRRCRIRSSRRNRRAISASRPSCQSRRRPRGSKNSRRDCSSIRVSTSRPTRRSTSCPVSKLPNGTRNSTATTGASVSLVTTRPLQARAIESSSGSEPRTLDDPPAAVSHNRNRSTRKRPDVELSSTSGRSQTASGSPYAAGLGAARCHFESGFQVGTSAAFATLSATTRPMDAVVLAPPQFQLSPTTSVTW